MLKASLFSIHLVPQSQGHCISLKDILFNSLSVLVRGVFDWNVYSEFIYLQVSSNVLVLFSLSLFPAPLQSLLVWPQINSTTTSVHKANLSIYLQFCWWSYWSLSLRFAWSCLVWRPPQTSGDQCSTYKERKSRVILADNVNQRTITFPKIPLLALLYSFTCHEKISQKIYSLG